MVRAAVPEIVSQRVTDLLGQRQHPLAAALPGAQAELPRPPIQIVNFEGGDLAGAQAQTCQQREDRPVTIRPRTGRGRTLQQARELLRGEARGQAGMPRVPHGRDGAVEPARSNTAPGQEPQEGARGARSGRAAVLRPVCGLLPDELGHPLDGQASPIGGTWAGIGRDEASHRGHISQPCGIGRPDHVAQVVNVADDPKAGVVIRRVHDHLLAAVLAARRGSRIMPTLRHAKRCWSGRATLYDRARSA